MRLRLHNQVSSRMLMQAQSLECNRPALFRAMAKGRLVSPEMHIPLMTSLLILACSQGKPTHRDEENAKCLLRTRNHQLCHGILLVALPATRKRTAERDACEKVSITLYRSSTRRCASQIPLISFRQQEIACPVLSAAGDLLLDMRLLLATWLRSGSNVSPSLQRRTELIRRIRSMQMMMMQRRWPER